MQLACSVRSTAAAAAMARICAKVLCPLVFLAAATVVVSNPEEYFPGPQQALLKSACDGTLPPEFCVLGKFVLDIYIKESNKLSELVAKIGHHRWALNQQQRHAVDDCTQLFHITLSELSDIFSSFRGNGSTAGFLNQRQVDDVQTWLSAALTNQQTCLQSLRESKMIRVSSSNNLDLSQNLQQQQKITLRNSLRNVTRTLRMSLALVKNITVVDGKSRRDAEKPPSSSSQRRRSFPEGAPEWLSVKKKLRLLKLQDDAHGIIPAKDDVVTVAQDGTGSFSTITNAINAAPNNSADVHIIYVKAGVYQEYVLVPSSKKNIMLVGAGANVTVITGNRSVGPNFTTFGSATFAAVGHGFMARDITFENTAGPENNEAVALRVSSDLSAFYRCAFKGYQDTLYVHSLRQFYSECDVYGTVDFIFGNAAAVFQRCNLYARKPLPSQSDLYTAQGRNDPNQNTGICIQKCILTLDPSLSATTEHRGSFNVFLGRPWRKYSRTVVMQSFIHGGVDPRGWQPWSSEDEERLSTVYFGEFMNFGPGAATAARVKWRGYHVMNASDAFQFTVANFIGGDWWIQSVPFDRGL